MKKTSPTIFLTTRRGFDTLNNFIEILKRHQCHAWVNSRRSLGVFIIKGDPENNMA